MKHLFRIAGEIVIDTSGNIMENIQGNVFKNITLDYTKTIGGDYRKEVDKNHNVKIGHNFTNFIGGISEWKINDSEKKDIHGDLSVTVAGTTSYNITKAWNNIVGENFSLNANDHVTIDTTSGNINLTTHGKFEIMKDGNITGPGYKNLGNRGNIKLTSTFGNIGLFTKEDKEWADLEV